MTLLIDKLVVGGWIELLGLSLWWEASHRQHSLLAATQSGGGRGGGWTLPLCVEYYDLAGGPGSDVTTLGVEIEFPAIP